MKTIATAIISGVAVLTLTSPAVAGVGSQVRQPGRSCHRGERARSARYDERCPEHDGNGSILF